MNRRNPLKKTQTTDKPNIACSNQISMKWKTWNIFSPFSTQFLSVFSHQHWHNKLERKREKIQIETVQIFNKGNSIKCWKVYGKLMEKHNLKTHLLYSSVPASNYNPFIKVPWKLLKIQSILVISIKINFPLEKCRKRKVIFN
jgi:hypothetical protein